MIMKEKAIKLALQKRKNSLKDFENAAQKNWEKALKVPEINKAYNAYVMLACDIYSKENTLGTALDLLKSTYEKYGFKASDFEAKHICDKCNDTGFVNGKICDCIKEDYISALEDVTDIKKLAPFTFEDCDLDKVKDEKQRELLGKLYGFMQKYSAALPHVKTKTITLLGHPGTGKTCLASATARAAVKNGKSCVFTSAFEFNKQMLAVHLSPVETHDDLMKVYLTCDLLVIDDLGIEPTYKNVTVEYLLIVLEERARTGLCTIITSNLSEADLQTRYKDRIMSRLLDKNVAKMVYIAGNDLRH